MRPDNPELTLVEQRLTEVYRRAQAFIDEQLAAIANSPLAGSLRGRLREMRDRVDLLLRHVDVQAASWVNHDLPIVFRLGVRDAAVSIGTFSQVSPLAVSELAMGTLRPLLTASHHVADDIKALMTKVADDAALEHVIGLRDLRGARKRMTELVEQRGVSAAVYRDGTRMPLDSYAGMVIRTRTAVAFNAGTLAATRASGTRFVEVFDGPGCGWLDHDDAQEANGMIVSVDEAAANPLSHPNCRRAFGPRPDITDPASAELIRH